MTDLPDPPEQDEVPPPEPAGSPLDRLGPRATRRVTPRFGVAIATAGSVLAVGGAVGIGGDGLVDADGDVERIPGIVVALLLLIVGMAAVARFRTGALAAAGAIASAASIPVLLFFVTFDVDDFPPVSLDAVLLVSAVVWFVMHVVGPASGRLLFLALALVGSWAFVMNLVEPIEELNPFAAIAMSGQMSVEDSVSSSLEASPRPFEVDEDGNPVFDEDGQIVFTEDLATEAPAPMLPDRDFGPPDTTTLGVISLLFGGAYLLAALVLSRRGYAGTGTPFAGVGAVVLAVGVSFVAPDLEVTGTGLLLIGIGLATATVGAASARRFTTWFGAAAVALGVGVLLGDALEGESSMTTSLAFLAVGLVMVLVAHLAGTGLREPDEEDEVASFG